MIVKEKILFNTPVLYTEIIKDLVEQRKYRNLTDFVNEAIKEKLQKDNINLEPVKELIEGVDWFLQ